MADDKATKSRKLQNIQKERQQLLLEQRQLTIAQRLAALDDEEEQINEPIPECSNSATNISASAVSQKAFGHTDNTSCVNAVKDQFQSPKQDLTSSCSSRASYELTNDTTVWLPIPAQLANSDNEEGWQMQNTDDLGHCLVGSDVEAVATRKTNFRTGLREHRPAEGVFGRPRYAPIVDDPKYATVVLDVDGYAVELACCFCGGNCISSSKVLQLFCGAARLTTHISVSHSTNKLQGYNQRSVVERYVKHALTEAELAAVRNKQYDLYRSTRSLRPVLTLVLTLLWHAASIEPLFAVPWKTIESTSMDAQRLQATGI